MRTDSDTTTPPEIGLSELLRTVRRHWLVIVLPALLLAAGGFARTKLQAEWREQVVGTLIEQAGALKLYAPGSLERPEPRRTALEAASSRSLGSVFGGYVGPVLSIRSQIRESGTAPPV